MSGGMLFPKADVPRSKAVKRMTVVDAGEHPNGGKGICFECRHCGHNTGWIRDQLTVTENKRAYLALSAANTSQRSNPMTDTPAPQGQYDDLVKRYINDYARPFPLPQVAGMVVQPRYAIYESELAELVSAITTLQQQVRDARGKALEDAEAAAQGPVKAVNAAGEVVYRGNEQQNWTPTGEYGRGRTDAATAILTLRDKP